MDELFGNEREEVAGELLMAINRFVEAAREAGRDEDTIKSMIEWAIEFANVHWEDL